MPRPPLTAWVVPLSLFLLLLPAGAAPAAAQGEKALFKLGLLLGDDRDRRADAEVLAAATTAFITSRRFTMVERRQLDAVFTEKNLQEFLGKGNRQLSDVLGLDLLGIVSYTVEQRPSPGGGSTATVVIDVQLVDAQTGQILTTISSDRPDVLVPPATARDAGSHLFQSVREAFPPFGYVVRLTGKDVVVDLGTGAGIKEGDVLEIVREGEQIIHPVTGETLPAEMLLVGELKVVSASPQLSNCKLKSASGEVALGSLVRLKEKNSLFKKTLRKVTPYVPWVKPGGR